MNTKDTSGRELQPSTSSGFPGARQMRHPLFSSIVIMAFAIAVVACLLPTNAEGQFEPASAGRAAQAVDPSQEDKPDPAFEEAELDEDLELIDDDLMDDGEIIDGDLIEDDELSDKDLVSPQADYALEDVDQGDRGDPETDRDPTIWYVDDDAALGGDGTSWATAYRYFQDAIHAAVAGDEIRVAGGTYRPDQDEGGNVTANDRDASFDLISGVSWYGGFAGLQEPGNEDARDLSLYRTILFGDLAGNDTAWDNMSENTKHLVMADNVDDTALVDGFEITAGWASGEPRFYDCGGGMHVSESSPTIRNCHFYGNGSEYIDNPGDDTGGGAMVVMTHSAPLIVNCRFTRNYSEWDGGGLSSELFANPVLVNCTFEGNRSVRYGGAIFNSGTNIPGYANSSLTMVNCVVVGNVTWRGGGIFNLGPDTYIYNSTFVGNDGGVEGLSTVYNSNNDGVFVNSIFWGYYICPQIINSGSTNISVEYCCVGDGYPGDGNVWDGLGNIDSNPFFRAAPSNGADGDWGSPDDDYGDLRLSLGSACADSGASPVVTADVADLDGDGDVDEQIPYDILGMPRFNDDPLAPDSGVLGHPDYIVDMGAYETDLSSAGGIGLAAVVEAPEYICSGGFCHCDPQDASCDEGSIADLACGHDDDCDVAKELSDPVVESTCITGTCSGGDSHGDACSEDAHCEAPKAFYYAGDDEWYASDVGKLTMSWRNAEGDEIGQGSVTVLPWATTADNVFETKYFIDALPNSDAAAFVSTSPTYETVIRYNSRITENSEPGNPEDKDIKIISDLIHVRSGTSPGVVVLQYVDGAPPYNPTVAFEVLSLISRGYVEPSQEFVGRKIEPPAGAEGSCGTKFINNEIAGEPVAWARQEMGAAGVVNSTDIWPIRPFDVPSRLQIVWYKRSANDTVDLETCWPVEITKHTAVWPDDPQINVINSDDPTIAPLVDLQVGDGLPYCKAYRLYEEAFDGSESLAYSAPGQDLGSEFAVQRTGYSVLLFQSNPGGLGSSCGDIATFEVVATYDHRDVSADPGYPNEGAPVYDGAAELVDIGVSIEKPSDHDSETPLYPFGYIHSGLPYADVFYDGAKATGQVIGVNRSGMYSDDEKGQLEVWYFQPGREATGVDGDSGDFAEGVYWPHKVYRYDLDWPATTEQIVIENRNGAHCQGDDCEIGGGYPDLSSVYSKGLFSEMAQDKDELVGWNPNDEHAQLIPAGDGALKAFAVRDDDSWAIGEQPYVLVSYPKEPEDPTGPEEVTEWAMGVHEVIASDGDPACSWDGSDDGSFDCFVYDGVGDNPAVYAGAPISPPLYPVNYFAELCVDEFYNPMTYIYNAPNEPPTALWTDRTGLVWAVEDYTDGRDTEFPEGTDSSSQIYLWENWVGDDLDGAYGTCDPWRDFGTGVPTPIRYAPTWPDVPPDCNYEGGDPNCARPVKIGETIAHGVRSQCGIIRFLHDSANAVVIDPLECVGEHMDAADAMALDFSQLPPHLGGGQISGGGVMIPARIEYVAAGSPMELHEEAKCGDFLSEQLLFVGVMSERDRAYLLRLDGLSEVDCYEPDGTLKSGAAPFCVTIDNLFHASRAQLSKRCQGGANDGDMCSSDADCPPECDPICVGGMMNGETCANGSVDCLPPGGYCDGFNCAGGPNDGMPCTLDEQCAADPDGSQCVDMCPPGECGYTQERPHVVSLSNPDVKPGWITTAFQNDGYCESEGAVVAVEVWNVGCGPEPGMINVIEAKCPFSESVVLQHNGDAGGEPNRLSYEWQVSIDYNPLDHAENPDLATWVSYSASGLGAHEVVLDGALDPVYTLIDSWWRVRYRGYEACGCGDAGEPLCPGDWPTFLSEQAPDLDDTAVSEFTTPALCEGWIKRVIRRFNAFDQRINEFHTTEIATYVNMIRQAGIRYEGPVALNCNPDNINSLGLIETYATVLARARQFLAAALMEETPDAANLALLLAASKISDLYMLLGNEAYADAMDPTIGLFPLEGEIAPPAAPESIFCFQGQVPDLLTEELVLLRGLDRKRALDVHPITGEIMATVYNRIPWNFTSTDGQIAYANNYQVTAVIDATGEDGAMIRYPQGHGDAWGHYLTATKEFYKLLTSEFFNWVVSTEAVNVAGQAVPVSFEYERKFAAAAASKARAGAAITSMTFRQLYLAEPGQKDGYPDDQEQRRWGLADWARRAGQASYLDWVVVNSLLDDEDTEHEEGSIQKVDRVTVADIGEIASSFEEIQTVLDHADADLNPLGLANNVVPFGLNPSSIEEGMTHFDQIYERSVAALHNAVRVFEYANSNDQRLRSVQDSAESFDELVDEAETDYSSRLIEIFGRPYPEDIGPGGTYPAGYDGPDLLHFDYVEPSALLGLDGVNLTGNAATVTRVLPWSEIMSAYSDTVVLEDCADQMNPPSGGVCTGEIVAKFHISTDGLGLIKPEGWTRRIEPGEIQLARSELVQAFGQYMQSVASYEAQLNLIKIQLAQVEQTSSVTRGNMTLRWIGEETTVGAEALIHTLEGVVSGLRLKSEAIQGAIESSARAADMWAIAGTACGTNAAAKAALGTIYGMKHATDSAFDIAAEIIEDITRALQWGIDTANRQLQLVIESNEGELLIGNEVRELERLFAEMPALQIEAMTLAEAVDAAAGHYKSALGSGIRLLEQRTAFRQRSARQVSEYRYLDMAFRIFRNDSLQKYRAQFDLAARYAFLAAKAYDYETALLGSDTSVGQQFLSNIVKQRVLGESDYYEGPLPGVGLAGQLVELADNFEVLRTQLGFNNDAAELSRMFSLRWENYRIPNTEEYDSQWRDTLRSAVVPDIRQEWEYRQFAIPFDVQSAIPGIVLRFDTELTAGKNLFGWPSMGDELYPTTYFAIKLHSIGLRFEEYPGAPLNNQVECYLLPSGADVMRVPSCTFPRIRNFNLLDQTLPVPFPVGEGDFSSEGWMPWDGVVGGASAFVQRRLYPTISSRQLDDDLESDLSYILTGRSAWNTQWTLIIPGISLQGVDQDGGIDVFIDGLGETPGVQDIKLLFNSYGYFGCTDGGKRGSDDQGQPSGDEDRKGGPIGSEQDGEGDEFVPLPVIVVYPEVEFTESAGPQAVSDEQGY